MKREILCMSCGSKSYKQYNKLVLIDGQYTIVDPFPGEYLKYTIGKVKRDFRCDLCNTDINKGNKACCYSIWSDHSGAPYFPWEHEYLDVNKEDL